MKNKKTPKDYQVTWKIDLSAAHPIGAAEEALEAMQKPTLATVFEVTECQGSDVRPVGPSFTVDLSEGRVTPLETAGPPPQHSAACPVCGSIYLDSDEAATCCPEYRRSEE